jgi:hypothetical protein
MHVDKGGSRITVVADGFRGVNVYIQVAQKMVIYLFFGLHTCAPERLTIYIHHMQHWRRPDLPKHEQLTMTY